MYQISGRDVIYNWLSGEEVLERRIALMEWLVELANSPSDRGQRVPGVRAPVYVAVLRHPPVVIRYLVAEQFQTVRIIDILSQR